MAICRWSDASDLYVFRDVRGGYTCMSCELTGCRSSDALAGHNNPNGEFHVDTPEEMLQHLQEHKDNGNKVPDRAFSALHKEINNG